MNPWEGVVVDTKMGLSRKSKHFYLFPLHSWTTYLNKTGIKLVS